MAFYKDRLKALRKSRGLSQAMLASELGLVRSAISMYESGSRTPEFETLEAICDFFNVNMSELSDVSSIHSFQQGIVNDMPSFGNRAVMAENIQHYIDFKRITRQELCDALGFKYSTVSEWLQARKYPRIDKIEMMANYFGVNKADLVEYHLPYHTLKEYEASKQPIPQPVSDAPNHAGTINNSTINGNVHNTGIITTVSPVPIPDICKMCQSLSPKARAQIDSLVNMLHEMEHGK